MNAVRVRIGLVALGLAAYVFSLVAFAPAGLLAPLLERASGGEATLGEARGTLWSGDATFAIRRGGIYRSVAQLEWRCNPLWVVAGRLRAAIALRAPDTELHATLQLRPGGLRIEDLQASAPAAFIESVLPIAGIAGPEGRLRLHADAIDLTRMSIAGTATLDWENAGLRQWQWSQLGDYRLEATGQGARAAITNRHKPMVVPPMRIIPVSPSRRSSRDTSTP